MKNFLLLAAIVCYTSINAFAQHDHRSHQNTNSKKDTTTKATAIDVSSQQQLSQLLSSYYNIKNALVDGNANAASSNAGLFLKTVNAIDFKVIAEGNVLTLSKNAGEISKTKDLKKQREYFVDLSSKMATLAKSFEPGNQPIYLQYCPMAKASWLSAEQQIRVPYYGSSMLTCGEVTETL